jgi:DNA-binding Lrp family transcriptional regulator
MDLTDRRILQTVQRNARITFRELSERMGISIPSVQKRLVSMERAGIIQGYTAHISLAALGGSFVLIHGRSRAGFAIDAMDFLGGHEAVSTVLCGSQNHLYVGAFLKKIDHLDAVVTFVKEAGEVPEPEALIFNTSSDITCVRNPSGDPDASELTDLDHRIIRALHENARRPLAEVAADVGVSAKTASIRLDRMMAKGLIEYHVAALPHLHASEVLLTVRIRPDADRRKIVGMMRDDPDCFVDEDVTFSNAPNMVLFTLEVENMDQLYRLLNRVIRFDGVEGIYHDVLLHQKYYSTWRDRLLKERARPAAARASR